MRHMFRAQVRPNYAAGFWHNAPPRGRAYVTAQVIPARPSLSPEPLDDTEPCALTPIPTQLPALVRRLTPVQGIDVVVPFADVFELIASQLQEPDRLRPRHRIPCRADIFASIAGAPWQEIVAAVEDDLDAERAVTPLTEPLATTLGLQSFLAAPSPVISLRVADDPTEPALEVRSEARSITGVPARFANEWEFILSRKEAVQAARTARRRARSWWGRLLARLRATRKSREREAWFRRLADRPLDEQLFGVRPASSLLLDPSSRKRIRGALTVGGYEVDRMLMEWEIHWRRKGV